MLNREELREIAEIHGNGNYFVSMYLNVNPVTNPKGDYVIHFKNMLRGISDGVEKKILKKITADIEKMEAFIVNNKRGFRKGLAILSSAEGAFWKDYNLAVPVKNGIIVDRTPYIEPLLDIINNYQRYAVVLVDKESARLFLVQLGEIVEYGEVHTADIPGKHKKGGWFALSQNHYERHIDYHVGLHLKDVIKKLETFLKAEKIENVVLGGSPEAVSMFREMIQKTVADKLIGAFSSEMIAKNNEVLQKAMPVIAGYEKEKEKTSVSELMTGAMKGGNAVIGMENVLSALQEGRVMRLLFVKDFKESGFACKNCRYITKQKVSACPYCNNAIEQINYLVDLTAQKAVEHGAIVEVVSENKELSKAGNIGAFLRF